jgi:hypothetical protein
VEPGRLSCGPGGRLFGLLDRGLAEQGILLPLALVSPAWLLYSHCHCPSFYVPEGCRPSPYGRGAANLLHLIPLVRPGPPSAPATVSYGHEHGRRLGERRKTEQWSHQPAQRLHRRLHCTAPHGNGHSIIWCGLASPYGLTAHTQPPRVAGAASLEAKELFTRHESRLLSFDSGRGAATCHYS